MASGESEGNHILLAVAVSLAERLDSLAESFEEFRVIYHAAGPCTFSSRNTTSKLALGPVRAGHWRGKLLRLSAQSNTDFRIFPSFYILYSLIFVKAIRL